MTDLTDFTQPLTIDSTVDEPIKGMPGDAIAADFLVHYESFIGGDHDRWLAWQTPPFCADTATANGSQVWVKAGVAGFFGLAALTTAGVLLSEDAVQAIAQVPQTLSPPITPASAPLQISPLAAIAPVESQPEVYRATPNPAGSVPKLTSSVPNLTMPPAISPTLRSPLPAGQVISQQQAASPAIAGRLAIARPQAMPLPEWATAKITVKATVKVKATANAIPNSTPSASSAAVAIAPLPRTTVLPVAVAINPALSSAPPQTSVPTPVNPAKTSAKLTSPTAPQPVKITINQIDQQSATEIPRPTVLSAKPSAPLTQSINAASTLQDFLKLSQQLPENHSENNASAVLPLTPQAALAVPKHQELQQFQIFRMSATLYQKAWLAMTQTKTQTDGTPSSPPKYGFINYPERAIVLPSS